ncbi:MAG: DUF4350 domain-containing protein [Aquificae bacterium]|nr:DUF4350 domain-containing protein [Aquificota bacterium]
MRVGWDISHQEFTVTDYYYFSILQKATRKEGITVDEVENWEELDRYDVIVLNYPEIPFTQEEVERVRRWVEEGKRVILAGYYKNEDRIADTCNSLARAFGLELNPDEVTDPESNYRNEPYFVVTSRVKAFNDGVEAVMFACSASVTVKNPNAKVLLEAENTAVSNKGFKPVLGAYYESESGGQFCLLGTCVFWDNYSIELFSNLRFALNLLKKV